MLSSLEARLPLQVFVFVFDAQSHPLQFPLAQQLSLFSVVAVKPAVEVDVETVALDFLIFFRVLTNVPVSLPP